MNLTGQPIYQKGQKPRKSKPLRDASRDATCTLRIPGICLPGNETVVGCHVRMTGFCGVALKPDDLFLIDGCSACHAALDSRDWKDLGLTWNDVLRALMESQLRRKEAGLIRVTA